MEDLLITVMAHKAAQETVLRHKPYWDALGKVIYFCPADSLVDVSGSQIVSCGTKSHSGPQSIARFRYLLSFLLGIGVERHVIFEYDSICLGPLPEWPWDSLAGNIFHEDHTGPVFRSKRFIHPPLCFNRDVLQAINYWMRKVPNDAEGAYWDRWLGLVCQEGSIPLHNFMTTGEGFSHNTIHEAHWEGARQARLSGAKVFHGIKDQRTLEAILK